MFKWTAIAGVAAGMLLLGGCAAPLPPTAQVQAIELTDHTATGVRVAFTLLVTNPNDQPLPVRAVDYTVRLENVGSFHFTDSPAVTLPPNGTQTIVLGAGIAHGEPMPADQPVRVNGRVRYQAPGHFASIMADYGLPLPRISFDGSEAIDPPARSRSAIAQ